jgi:hypothetical protein
MAIPLTCVRDVARAQHGLGGQQVEHEGAVAGALLAAPAGRGGVWKGGGA